MQKTNLTILKRTKQLIYSKKLREKFRVSSKHFTRKRKMPFDRVLLFMMSMVKKSLQLELINFVQSLNLKSINHVSNSAYNQARMKIKPDVFQYLMQSVNDEFYTANDQRVVLWNGFRLLACDGSFLNMPLAENLIQKYGMATSNQHNTQVFNVRCSVLYDLENKMILDGALAGYKTGEREMLMSQLKVINKNSFKNLIVLDRGYPSFELVHELNKRKIDFVIRLQSNFSNAVTTFIKSDKQDIVLDIEPGKNTSFLNKFFTKKSTITVRLIKVVLDNGTIEVLMTSLTENNFFPIEIFKELYFKRWGIETLYDKLKNKLKIESFTGYSQTSILQDFYCSLFLSNIQSLLTSEANDELKKQNVTDKKYEYKVNANLSIGFIKTRIIDLFMKESDEQKILKELENLFLKSTIPIRPNRAFPRNTNKFRIRKKPPVIKNFKPCL
jgi:Transposase DDE domain